MILLVNIYLLSSDACFCLAVFMLLLSTRVNREACLVLRIHRCDVTLTANSGISLLFLLFRTISIYYVLEINVSALFSDAGLSLEAFTRSQATYR